ncbi:MAG: response regulator transcription factor [Deltaproteobacteria bacterium]|nr:response regulator transcription factor [Deltaproteobacteria bacterium]
MTETLLLIDDDKDLTELLEDYLSAEGFTVVVQNDGKGGLERAVASPPTLIVLDVMLPGMNGFDVLRELRRTHKTPVLMLTARGDDIDRIVGLELGADDYLAKPFNPRELVARIRAILRRVGEPPASPAVGAAPAAPGPEARALVVGDVELHPGALTARRAGETGPRTSAEFGFLEVLLEQAGQVVSREALCEKVLGRRLSAWDRSIDVHMSNLRKKLGKDAEGRERIKTVRGVGYLYAVPEGPGAPGGTGGGHA